MHAEHAHNDLNQKVCLECNRQFTGIVAACPHDGTLLVNVIQDPLIGTTLAGSYEIMEVAGHGGMGVVYKARHALMDRTVAIKMLHGSLISDSMSVKRFQQESKAASKINHPHVITVYDFGISPQGQPYIVMDFLQGISLADIIKAEGQVGVERSIRILSQACDALDHAHKQGVVHRDLKPTNIVLINYDDDKDFVKVVDFGVAKLMEPGAEGQKLTQAGEVCGSPVYMSPEQCTGLELDARSDIYSMGIMIYETLTGHLPLLGKTMVETMSKHISEMPASFAQSRPDLYIPERLEAVCFKALAKDPADRHQSMEELRIDLELAIPRPGKSQVLRSAVGDQTPADTIIDVLKHTPIIVMATAACLVLGGVIGWYYIMQHNMLHPKLPQHPPQIQAQVPVAPPPVATVKPAGATTPASGTGTASPGKSAESAQAPRTHDSLSPTASTEEPNTAEQPGHARHNAFAHASSPEEIVEASHQAKPKPVHHKKPPHPATASASPGPAAPKSSAPQGDRWTALLKSRGY